jgi:iron complex transport system permease protein
MKVSRLLLLLALIAMSSLILAVSVGSTNYGVKALAAAVVGTERGAAADPGSLVRQVIFELRLPRALNAFSTGGLLALAGVLMQVLLRNPLADPYVLGI